MQKFILFSLLLISFRQLKAQYTICNGKSYPALSFSAAALQKMNTDLQTARINYEQDSSNADHIIWYGRRLAYLGRYTEAIQLFSKGITLHPTDARMYRHRGHRYLTTRCYDKAIADFEKAAVLIKGKPDETEPDGMPNAQNIPTSSLQSNIWYHLGLAYFLKKEFAKAEAAYSECLNVSANPDMYVATANWYYLTLRKLGKDKEAAALLATIQKNMSLIENKDYLTILLLYKGEQHADEIRQKLLTDQNTLSNATLGFGLGYYYIQFGKPAEGKELLQKLTQSTQWGSFAYMAAEMQLVEQ
ncbi:MAG: tetratricopeptide repeat protein [Chitinophagaceae bacterium]|nr:tetratricopeptide repeat protein [Chitinophagaceae bacterium]